MNNEFHYNVRRSKTYCPERDEKGRHIKGKDGYKYKSVCSTDNGDKLYLNKQDAISNLSEAINEECKKQNLKYKFVGQKNIKEFVRMSKSHCQTIVTENKDTSVYDKSYKNESYTSNYQDSDTSGTGYSTITCTPSRPIYRYSTDLYYSCVPK